MLRAGHALKDSIRLPPSLSRVWVATSGWEKHVQHEVGPKAVQWGRLFMWPSDAGSDIPQSFWAENIWRSPQIVSYNSIGNASKQLRAVQRNWSPHIELLRGRTALIQDTLPQLSTKNKKFPFELPASNMGAFCLVDDRTMIMSSLTDNPFPGPVTFEENHVDPPSKAYLKLWEAMTRMNRRPSPGDRCLDVGAYPGSWTWVLDSLGASVLAIDRQPVVPKLLTSSRIRCESGNAFLVLPESLPEYGWDKLDWLCSDLVCYPSKLFPWVKKWFDSGLVKNFVISVKMQGEPDWESAQLFASLPGGKLFHGNHNKHELTWVWPWRPHEQILSRTKDSSQV